MSKTYRRNIYRGLRVTTEGFDGEPFFEWEPGRAVKVRRLPGLERFLCGPECFLCQRGRRMKRELHSKPRRRASKAELDREVEAMRYDYPELSGIVISR